MLNKNPTARITANDALVHEYFDDILDSFDVSGDKTSYHSQ